MFKFITLSCLLAVGAQCKTPQNTAVPYYPQPYPTPNPQFYAAQPKYNAQPAYVAAAPYRQVLVPANPAYNPYYYGYAPYPAYPQQYAYPYVQNDGAQAPAAAQPGWGEYLSSIWNYVPNYPFGGSSESQTSGAESASSVSSSGSTAESSVTAEANPEKGDKPTEGQKAEQQSASNEQSTAQSPSKQSAPAAFEYFGHPQYFGQLPYQPVAYDPTKLNTASNGAVSNFWFYRNQAQPEFQAPQSVFQAPQPVFPAPQPFADQKYYQNPAQFNHGTAALAYQRYLQYQKQQQGQFQEGQFQQQQDQQFQQQQPQQPQSQDQQFRQQPAFEQQSQKQQQQYEQHSQQDEPSVVVDSNVAGVQEAENQPQSKLATGPTIAVAQPQGMAFAGIGGRAGAGPIGTAIVGNNSTAISEPSGTAISLDLTPTINLAPVHKLTSAYVAKYAPELGVYRVAEIKTPEH